MIDTLGLPCPHLSPVDIRTYASIHVGPMQRLSASTGIVMFRCVCALGLPPFSLLLRSLVPNGDLTRGARGWPRKQASGADCSVYSFHGSDHLRNQLPAIFQVIGLAESIC